MFLLKKTLVFQPPCLVEPCLFQTAGRFQPAVSKNVVKLKAFYNDIIAGLRIFKRNGPTKPYSKWAKFQL